MPSGIILKDANLVTQIDTTSAPVLAFRKKGTATLATVHPASRPLAQFGTVARYVDLTITDVDIPLIAFAGTNAYGLLSVVRSGSSMTIRVAGYQHGTSSPNPPFEWYHFDRPQPAATGGVMQINDSSGKCVFSAIRPPLIVETATKAESVSLNASRKWAVVANSFITQREWDDHFTNQDVYTWWETNVQLGYATQTATNGVKTGGLTSMTIDSGSGWGSPMIPRPSGDLGGYGTNSAALIIDVTDIP